ncbi:MAG: prenyltransferase/squalene oxidase repeat-containing protein [bacterium]
MKNKKIALLIIILLFTSTKIFADDVIPPTPLDPVNIHLTMTDNTGSLYDQVINVNACNSDNGTTSELKITAYCAILQSGITNDWNWSWPPGAFLNSLNNIAGYTSKDANNNDVYHYWSWSLNNTEGMIGLNQYILQTNDLVSLNFIDPITPTPTPEIVPTPHSSGGGGALLQPTTQVIKNTFNIKKAYEFLALQQKENGSFGTDLYSDWSSFAFASNSDYQTQKDKLIKYLTEVKTANYQLTDYERHAMALMALGINPYAVNGENHIEKIISSFDGTQFGDKEEDNDDIFALIVLQNAGYTINDKIISDDLNFILSKQKENGSWDNSVDMTGAAISSIATFAGENFLLRGVSQADGPRASVWKATSDSDLEKEEFSTAKKIISVLSKAKEYLKQNQKDDGGFGNVSSTAWAMEGIIALNEKPEDWIPARPHENSGAGEKNNNTPLDYLATNQDIDGGMKEYSLENRIWQTSYVLTSLSGKTWNQLMQKFEKQVTEINEIKTEVKIENIKKNTQPKIKQISKKINSLASVNVASTISAVDQNIEPVKKQTWFRRFINKLFGL